MKNKTPAKAKAGQEAPEDIEIKAGITDLPPGPAISELGAVGLQVQIKKGKIEIKESKVIVKKGEVISKEASEVMAKMDILPFSIGLIPICAFDNKNKKFYANINVNKEEALNKLQEAHGRALPFAVEIGYPSKDTISFLIGKGHSHAKALEKLSPIESDKKDEEEQKESKTENQPTESENKKEELKDEENTQSDKTEGEEK